MYTIVTLCRENVQRDQEERMRGFLTNKSIDKKVFLLSLWLSIMTVGITGIICFFSMATYSNQSELILLLQKITIILIISLFFTIPFIYLSIRKLSSQIYEPVRQVSTGFKEMNRGNFDVKLEIEESDLRDQFNYITSRLSILAEKLVATNETTNDRSEIEKFNHIHDVFKQLENIIEKSMVFRELQRAEKMNAIGQLAASVAHEIRNPMTVVKGFLQIFLAKDQMSDEERMYIRLMIEEMNRAETIINDYLSLAKPDMEKTESIDGKELAEKAMDLMNSYAKMSKNIIMHTPVLDQVTVRGNKNELQQVLINILKNGIEALKDGGELSLSLFTEGAYGVFEISDTGIGMTGEELQRLGTAFYSLKEKGTGMGLTVCYQIIDRMKGKIDVKSEKDVGTTFKIYVPLYK
jgi:two-component system, sporulation sensor kinase B